MRTHRETAERDRLEDMVRQNLDGAELRNAKRVEDWGTQSIFIIVWQRGEEWGTHRAVINYESGEQMLIWGHYFRGPYAARDVYRAYVERIALRNYA